MLTIFDQHDGKCQLCCQTKTGCQCRFKDGLKGFFCETCMWALFKRRIHALVGNSPAEPAAQKASDRT